MTDEAPNATCLEYVPGEIIVVRWRSEEAEVVGSRFELGQVVESIHLDDPSGGRRRVIERIAVPVGSELRYIGIASRQQTTLSESLNYLGELASSASIRGEDVGSYMTAQPDGSFATSFDPRSLELDRPLLIAIDVEEGHCRKVLATASAGAKQYGGADIRLAGVYRPARSTTVGLYDYIALVAQLNTFRQCPDAVIMSVDFGLACLRRGSGERDVNPILGSAAIAAYSFPIFETSLAIILDRCRRKPAHFTRLTGELSAPAVFAAAGNRISPLGPTQRLAYPALRPEVIAVTHTEGSAMSGFRPSKTSDLPLVYDLKPVFAVSAEMAQAVNAPVDGTSFAAPWAASWYICQRIEAQSDPSRSRLFFDSLGRIAALQRLSERVRIEPDEGPKYVPSPINLLPASLSQVSGQDHKALDLAAGAISRLNREFPEFEFGVTGSAVALLTAAGPADAAAQVRPADIDLVYYAADAPSGEIRERIVARAAELLGPFFPGNESLPVELTSVDGRVAPLALLQCVIPAAATILTSAGLIDVWGGRLDIEMGVIRCLQPTPNGARNPQATAEHFARFPSYLVCLAVAGRLWTQWARSDLRHLRSCPDLEVDLSRAIEEVMAIEEPAAWGERTHRRFAKLVEVVAVGASCAEQSHSVEAPEKLMSSLTCLAELALSRTEFARDQALSALRLDAIALSSALARLRAPNPT